MMVARQLTNNPYLTGLLYSAYLLTFYLAVVLFTTPNLPPGEAIKAALGINGQFLTAAAISMGVHGFLRNISNRKSCRINNKTITTAVGGGSIFASITSFLSLTQVGCCGFWLYLISLLASTGGIGLSTASFILQEQGTIMVLGLSVVWVSNSILIFKITRKNLTKM